MFRYPYLLTIFAVFLFSRCAVIHNVLPKADPEQTQLCLQDNIVKYAESFIGTRYKYGGTSQRTGFDCSGFTMHVLGNFNVPLSHSSRSQEQEGERIDIKHAQPGDLVFFRKSKTGQVFHVALVVSNDPKDGLEVIHSTSSVGVIREKITGNKYWSPKLSSARRVLQRRV